MQSTDHPVVFGAPYSVYVRAVRLALEEKGVHYELVPIDIFTSEGAPAEHTARHPFGKIPAFEHAGFRLYEAGAITRYVDEAFPGPRLQPQDPCGRARMNQIVSILDSYAYRTLVWDIYVERVSRPARGGAADEQKIGGALPRAEVCLSALSDLIGESPWLAGQVSAWPTMLLPCSRFSALLPRVPVSSVVRIVWSDGGIASAYA
jgi:glutathione S-transferase